MLDVASAAEYLGVTESAMRHMIERGHLPALRLGGRVYLRRETLERHLKKLERQWTRVHGAGA